ncbi:MAG TPA: glycoside hydrolase family 3 N-terminal domain-containing protein [Salinivirga sp.]|uniref:glycoside hydrolase family 3 N-terminal domain-containing protein n=1 Tax=Salinivirga sp. TaxID=1970192 RepID=UPI002B46BABD|nr:glycoside hydrolase family 3 N-terminal domain-containing protein [Salinivirga sp.]HKK60085.1 glycoside hydrolase family 3 N-terminal domain-containing protein [Salinivirga sp.]
MRRYLLIFLLFLFSVPTLKSAPIQKGDYVFIDTTYHWVDSVFESLTLKQRIAQLIMVNTSSRDSEKSRRKITRLVKKYNIGGIIFFQGGPVRQALQTNHYQDLAKTPIMVAMDAEWGLAMRLDSVEPFPRQMMLGATDNNGLIYDMGTEIGRQCRRMGVHINFAPVVDVNNNPNNPVINSRSFGENKHKVLRKSYSYMQGMIDSRILVTAKHFPGHGDTDADSHHSLPVINHELKRLNEVELFPYKHLIRLGLNGIMVAHLQVNALDNRKNRPSSISKPTITGLLKNKLGFKGLVFTDALNMRGVADYYAPGQLEIEALKAGNDVLLYPADAEVAIHAIEKAIKDGDLSESLINQKCKRVLAAKYWLGLDKIEPIDTRGLLKDLNSEKTNELNNWFARESTTCIRNNNNHLPLGNESLNNLAVVTIGETEANMFHLRLNDYCKPDLYFIGKNATEKEIANVRKSISNYANTIIAVQQTSNSPYRQYGINANIISAIERMANAEQTSLVYFGNPYALKKMRGLQDYQSILITYHDNEYTRNYAAQVLMGGQQALGKLPVSIEGYPTGTAFKLKKTRLGYVHPDMVNARKSALAKVDAIAEEALLTNATPGCVVLAARHGDVFFHKAYGYHTYKNQLPVRRDDIYDLASVTKIAATMPALMYFYSNQELNLQKHIGDYLPLPDSSNPGSRKLINVLTHQARLKAWYPFYTQMIDSTGKYKPKFFTTKRSDTYSIEVAKNLFASQAAVDTLFHILDTLPLRERNGYKYSDIGYYYMYKIVETLSGMKFENFLEKTFYEPMKCMSATFNPHKNFPLRNTIPTEQDTIFRKQLVHGYVHDPGAAILGGICGHAGLFSSANDLAKIGQLYLNKGTYGDERFFSESTVEFFTRASFTHQDNRRGIGFDKPEYRKSHLGPTFWGIPLESYGHSGFTGTYLWCDPESGILYVFLSNRIYPDASNRKLIRDDIRTRIHKALYEAIKPRQLL